MHIISEMSVLEIICYFRIAETGLLGLRGSFFSFCD